MKALLLFTASSASKGLSDPKKLCQLLNAADPKSSFEFSFFEDLVFHITNQGFTITDVRTKKELSDFDVIYFRYWGKVQPLAMACAQYCKLKNIPFADEETLRRGSINKLNQYVNLRVLGITIPNTLVATHDNLLATYQQAGFQFPLIIKALGGTRGSDNYLVKTKQELQKTLNQNPDLLFCMQEFIPNDGDYRALVIENTIPLLIHRAATGGKHLNNISQGGRATKTSLDSLPTGVKKQAIRAAQFYGRNIAGVDIMQSSKDGNYYFLEVNRAPQIEHASLEAEKAKLVADYLAQKAR